MQRVHYVHVHELILHQACQLQSLSFNGHPIHIFSDLTATEAKRGAAFRDMRKRLHEIEGARFGFHLPAKFCITPPRAKESMFIDPQLTLYYVISIVHGSDAQENTSADWACMGGLYAWGLYVFSVLNTSRLVYSSHYLCSNKAKFIFRLLWLQLLTVLAASQAGLSLFAIWNVRGLGKSIKMNKFLSHMDNCSNYFHPGNTFKHY